MTLRKRLVLAATFGTAVLVAVVSGLFLLALRHGLIRNLDSALTARAADAVAELHAAPTVPVTTETTSGIVIQILTANATIIDGSDLLGAHSLLSPAQARAAARSTLTFDSAVPVSDGAYSGAPSSVRSGDRTRPSTTGPNPTEQLRVVAMTAPNGQVVAAAASRSPVDTAVVRAGVLLIAVDVLLIVVAGGGAWFLASAALRPVEAMRRQAAALPVAGAPNGIDVPGGHDELRRLAITFNDLLGRLQAAVERERAFVADAGHELRTPLTVLKGELDLASRPGRGVHDLQQMVSTAADEADRVIRIAEDLLTLVHPTDAAAMCPTDIGALVHASVKSLHTMPAARDVSFRIAGNSLTIADADPISLRRAIDNVVLNAIGHSRIGGTIDITALIDGDWCTVTVRDRGPGFPAAFLPHAFERFSQASPGRRREPGNRNGSGLGLSIVQTVLTAHGGDATAANHPDGGAEVVLRWPVAAAVGTPSDRLDA